MRGNFHAEKEDLRYGDFPFPGGLSSPEREKPLPPGLVPAVLCICAGLVMILYMRCELFACSVLRGKILGIPFEVAGILLAALCAASFILPLSLTRKILGPSLLSLFAGAEAYLAGFQVGKGVYCPFCLLYGAFMIAALIVTIRREGAGFLLLSPAGLLLIVLLGVTGYSWEIP